jgi:hypothetical protein
VRFKTEDGAEIAALPGFTANYLVELKSGASMVDLVFDAANLPVPTGNWAGVGNPKGCPIIADGSTTAVATPRIDGVVVKNAPNGAVFFRQVTNPKISNLTMTNVQTATTYVRSAAVEFYQVTDGKVIDCEVNGYTMKGYNLGNSIRVKVVRSHALGAGQNVGHAAHYEDGCTDCAYIDCNHEGVGFAYKSHNGIRPKLKGYVANGSAGMAYFQGSKDFTIDDCEHAADAASRQHIIVEGSAGAGAIDTGTISNCRGRRSVAGSTLNHVGIHFISDATNAVDNVSARDCTFENQYVTVWTQNATSAVFRNLQLDNIRSKTPTSNSFLLFTESVRLSNNRLDDSSDGSTPIAMFSAAGTPSKLWELIDNKFYNLAAPSEAIQIGYDLSNTFGVKLDALVVRGNRTENGNVFLRMDLSNTAGGAGTNYIKSLTIDDNTANGIAAANAMLLTFATVLKTRVHIVGNSLVDAALGTKNILITNAAQIQGGYAAANDINQITNWPVASLVAGLYGVIPVVQAAAIATPTAPGATYNQAEAASAKTAIDALRVAIKNLGGTA